MATPEIYKQARLDRLYIIRLRQAFNNEIFEHVIQRILKGDSIREISIYCESVNPEISRHTYRKYLRALEQQADGPIAKFREERQEQKIIEEFNRAKAKPADSTLAKLVAEAPSYATMRRLQRNVTKETKKLNTGIMIQYLWFCAQKRLDKMMDLEERMGIQMPNGYKQLEVLNKIVATALQYELGMTALMRKNGEGEAIDVTQLDPVAQELAKFDDVDRNLIHNLRQRFVKIAEENYESAPKGLEPDAGTAGGTTGTDTPATDSEPKPSST